MPVTPQPNYKHRECTATLRQALDEFYARNPDAIRTTGTGLKDRFFAAHDIVHVVFACDTTIRDEALTDFWTIFGTDLGFRTYLSYLKPLQDDLRAIIEQVGTRQLIFQSIKALPYVFVVYWRARKMRRKWRWQDHEQDLDRPLNELRRAYNILVL